jgi:hypothetical protein
LLLLALTACGRYNFEAIDPTGDARVGSDGGDGGGSAARCGGMSLLSDDFSGPLDIVRWGESYEDVAGMSEMTGGLARFTLQASQPGVTYAAFATARSYDLTGDAVVAESVSVPNPAAAGAESLFFVTAPSSQLLVQFVISLGMTRLRYRTSTDSTDLRVVPYDATAHHFLKLREQGGTMFGEVSADGQSWDPFGSVSVPWADATYTNVTLAGGTYQSAAAPGVVEWNGVNAGVTAPAGYCPIDGATATFTDGTLGPEWFVRYGPASCTETNGRLSLALPGSVSACELASRRSYDMTSRSIVGELASTTSDAAAQTRFGVATEPNTAATISNYGNAMMFEVYTAGLLIHQTPVGSRPSYNPTNHRLWRLRHEAGTSTIIAELGTASGTYIELDRYSGTWPVDNVFIVFSAQNFGTTTPGVAELTSLNP